MAPRKRAWLAGILTLAIFLGAIGWAAAWQSARAREEVEQDARVVAVQFANRIQSGLEQHRIALRQTANFFENSRQISEENFYDFALTMFRLTPRCLRISAVDAALQVRWVYPPEDNHFLVGFDTRSHPRVHETLARARQTRAPVLSPPLKLVDGPEGFILAMPIFRGEEFLGEVISAFRSTDFFASMMLPEVIERYDERVLNSGVQVFASAPFPSAGVQVPAAAETFTLDGAAWEAQVRPRDEVIAERLRSARAAVWMLGLLFALAAGGTAGAATWRARGWARPFAFGAAARPGPGASETVSRGQTLPDQKMETVRRFVDGILEQINDPLCTILGYSQLLLARDVSADIRSRLETVHGEAARMALVIKDLLTFAGKQPPEFKVLGLNGLIEKTLEAKARHFETARIKVEKDLDPELPKSRLDFHQIQRALLNLLDNAEQALTESGRGGTIQVRTRRAAERIEASISDDGPGIPGEIQDRIFEPFFTTRAAVGRAGLGLSLCYGIIREHGGSLRVESSAGGGACFVMDLPAAVAARERAVDDAASDGRLPRLRILVVDDEPALQDLLVDLLTARGHRVDTASDVPEALRKISGQDHDLIIADFRMPHGSGKDIYRAVVEKAPALAGRIIFTSGEGASRETREFVQDIGNEILFKPYGIEQIEQAIARATRN